MLNPRSGSHVGMFLAVQVSAGTDPAVDGHVESILDLWYTGRSVLILQAAGAGVIYTVHWIIGRAGECCRNPWRHGEARSRVTFMRGAVPRPARYQSRRAPPGARRKMVFSMSTPRLEGSSDQGKEEARSGSCADAGSTWDLGGKGDTRQRAYSDHATPGRVSEEFMQAVEGTAPSTGGGRTGAPIKTARRRTSSGRWRRPPGSAPIPGIQYDDTINGWQRPESAGYGHERARSTSTGQLVLQTGPHKHAEVPARYGHLRHRPVKKNSRADHHAMDI